MLNELLGVEVAQGIKEARWMTTTCAGRTSSRVAEEVLVPCEVGVT